MWAFERAGGRYHVVGRLVAKEHDENQLLRISVPSGDHPRNGGWNTQNVHKILNYKAFMPRIRECGAVAPISTISTSYASAAVSRMIGILGASSDKTGSSLKGVGKSEFGGGLAIAQGGSRLA